MKIFEINSYLFVSIEKKNFNKKAFDYGPFYNYILKFSLFIMTCLGFVSFTSFSLLSFCVFSSLLLVFEPTADWAVRAVFDFVLFNASFSIISLCTFIFLYDSFYKFCDISKWIIDN